MFDQSRSPEGSEIKTREHKENGPEDSGKAADLAGAGFGERGIRRNLLSGAGIGLVSAITLFGCAGDREQTVETSAAAAGAIQRFQQPPDARSNESRHINIANAAPALPRSSGEAAIAGLSAEVTVKRDKLGVPVISAKNFEDAVRAQGFLHAQERYFQMDLARRQVGGRLAEVFGNNLSGSDQYYRRFRFSEVAREIVKNLPADERKVLEAYRDGVNAGLKELAAPPPEYGMLKLQPEPWTVEDSMLVLLGMFDSMNFSVRYEKTLSVMKQNLPDELFRFLTPETSRFDVPLTGSREEYKPAKIPGPDVVNLAQARADLRRDGIVLLGEPLIGSNNWAVAGSRSVHGGALVANDPHLHLSAPGIWYRAELNWPGHALKGVSMPGNPGVVIGSNGM